jgi:hypothetical protein
MSTGIAKKRKFSRRKGLLLKKHKLTIMPIYGRFVINIDSVIMGVVIWGFVSHEGT